jgi:hypothetical protein
MHAWRIVLLINVFLVFFLSAEAGSKILKSSGEERLLQSEVTLARKTQIYFVLDLKEKKIYFKARGIVLRDLDIKKVKFWGRRENMELSTMTGKAAFSEPRREEILPENAKKDEKVSPATPPKTPATVDIKALELEDMPSSYSLKFDDGLVISVKPDNKGLITGLYSIAYSLNWYILKPIVTVWYAIQNRPYGALNLVMDENDARSLYWSIHEGSRVLIYNPQDH